MYMVNREVLPVLPMRASVHVTSQYKYKYLRPGEQLYIALHSSYWSLTWEKKFGFIENQSVFATGANGCVSCYHGCLGSKKFRPVSSVLSGGNKRPRKATCDGRDQSNLRQNVQTGKLLVPESLLIFRL